MPAAIQPERLEPPNKWIEDTGHNRVGSVKSMDSDRNILISLAMGRCCSNFFTPDLTTPSDPGIHTRAIFKIEGIWKIKNHRQTSPPSVIKASSIHAEATAGSLGFK